jgi:hypothetical protein
MNCIPTFVTTDEAVGATTIVCINRRPVAGTRKVADILNYINNIFNIISP